MDYRVHQEVDELRSCGAPGHHWDVPLSDGSQCGWKGKSGLMMSGHWYATLWHLWKQETHTHIEQGLFQISL